MVDLFYRGEIRRFEARREATEPSGIQIARSVRPSLSLGPDSPQVRVLESGKPILVSRCDAKSLSGHDGLDHEPFIQKSGAKSLLYVPMSSRGTTLGVLTLVSLDENRTFAGADLLFATDLASRVATAVDNARLYREAKDAVRGREDILSFVAHDLRTFLFGSRLGDRHVAALGPAGRAASRVERARPRPATERPDGAHDRGSAGRLQPRCGTALAEAVRLAGGGPAVAGGRDALRHGVRQRHCFQGRRTPTSPGTSAATPAG